MLTQVPVADMANPPNPDMGTRWVYIYMWLGIYYVLKYICYPIYVCFRVVCNQQLFAVKIIFYAI